MFVFMECVLMKLVSVFLQVSSWI